MPSGPEGSSGNEVSPVPQGNLAVSNGHPDAERMNYESGGMKFHLSAFILPNFPSHVLSGFSAQMAPAKFCRYCGTGAYRAYVAKRDPSQPNCSRLSFYRRSRRGQDHGRSYSRESSQLRAWTDAEPLQ